MMSYYPIQLSETYIDVVDENEKPKKDCIKCEIGLNIKFNSSVLEQHFFSTEQPIIEDLLVVAASVEFADRVKKRSHVIWGRYINITIPVFERQLWEQEETYNALVETLNFLTGDKWILNFKKRKYKNIKQTALPMRSNPPKVIMPFSNGLDSYLVGKLLDLEYGDEVQRVRIGGRAKFSKKSNNPNDRFLLTPFSIYAFNLPETSVRSRGFKFSILTAISGYLSNSKDIIIPESGQGSLGVALVPVGQIYPDYRNHPIFLRKVERFINLILNYNIFYKFPRIWFTKGQTLQAYLNINSSDSIWTKTKTCWQSSRQSSISGQHRQCGICAACMLRRLSVYTARANEPITNYLWENLKTPKFDQGVVKAMKPSQLKSMSEYAIAGTLHLQDLADVNKPFYNEDMLDNTTFKLANALNEPQPEVRRKLETMLRQHRKKWNDFLNYLGDSSFISQWVKREKYYDI
ncbi:MAG: 7-cyano-7-deazaguanine synthase [Thiofilum sp.]|uniref:7-cyano-7-deazaguanine synthase n=1 Tax=Thiofilum sp. TaxID=2212733 RepID=UPI0026005EF3|nr:7-cyano-7-deazaguanine synthase [Thiofilum sp.]MBK8454348.1 7-cyano-7-deazaguanine synthase [Thiofilum sp.]